MRKRAKDEEARGVPLPHDVRVLTHEQAQAFYNRMGAKQDWQAFYEAKATRDLIAHASFETAQAVFEFGCGTGAFAEMLSEAHRLLRPEGFLCLVSLTPGPMWFSRLVTGLWTGIHRPAPSLVGGCRPLELQMLLPAFGWQLVSVNVVTAFGIPSEIVVAKPQP